MLVFLKFGLPDQQNMRMKLFSEEDSKNQNGQKMFSMRSLSGSSSTRQNTESSKQRSLVESFIESNPTRALKWHSPKRVVIPPSMAF